VKKASPKARKASPKLRRSSVEWISPLVEIVRLEPGQELPDVPDDQPWLAVEASDDGRFVGTGWGYKSGGECVFYISLANSDLSLEAAVEAAVSWGSEHGVDRVWLKTDPAS
jgi:hypothetical protein